MSHVSVRDEVRRMLTDEWDDGPRIVELKNNYNALGTDLAAWAWPTFVLAREEQIGLGDLESRYWRETGEVQIVLGISPNVGTSSIEVMARDAASVFRGKVALNNSLVFRNAAPLREDFTDRAVTGNWYVGVVAVSYLFTYTDAEA